MFVHSEFDITDETEHTGLFTSHRFHLSEFETHECVFLGFVRVTVLYTYAYISMKMLHSHISDNEY